MLHIVFTGGGTGGHIIPNLAILQAIKEKYSEDIKILYIGSQDGPESTFIPNHGIDFAGIRPGKLRRYFSFQNFIDLFKIPFSIHKAKKILKKFKPHLVFSKGGYVSLPVVSAAKSLNIPVILHESDVIPGLANKLASRKADILLLGYPETQRYLSCEGRCKLEVTGNPVRKEILEGNQERGYEVTGFDPKIPVILVIGGSQGALHINEEMFLAANTLVPQYQIVHLCGTGKMPPEVPMPEKYRSRYKRYEYLEGPLKDIYAIADIVISRAGANTISEIEAWQIPAILIPLPSKSSRGEQAMNSYAHQTKFQNTVIIKDELLNYHTVIDAIHRLIPPDKPFIKASSVPVRPNQALTKIVNLIGDFVEVNLR